MTDMASRVLRQMNAVRLKVGLKPLPMPPSRPVGDVTVNHYRVLETEGGTRLVRVDKP